VDPGVCREHLSKLLAEEAASLARLETLLDREHELITANDIEASGRPETSFSYPACPRVPVEMPFSSSDPLPLSDPRCARWPPWS